MRKLSVPRHPPTGKAFLDYKEAPDEEIVVGDYVEKGRIFLDSAIGFAGDNKFTLHAFAFKAWHYQTPINGEARKHKNQFFRNIQWAYKDIVAEKERKEELKALALQKVVALGKMSAGFIRFLFEDVFQGSFQCIYLCKMWHHISIGTKAFTLLSISTSIALSALGPIMEYLSVRRLSKESTEINPDSPQGYALLETEGSDPVYALEAGDANLAESSIVVAGDAEKGPNKATPLIASSDDRDASDDLEIAKKVKKVKRDIVVSNETVEHFIRTRSTAHRLLVYVALAFWGTMALFPFAIDSKIECGKSIPGVAHLAFFAVSILSAMCEVWILIQTREGYLMFVEFRPKFVLGFVLGFLGRFDTYSDTMFAHRVTECDEITWFSVQGHVFHLPMELSKMVVVTLVIGVFVLQALPGLLTLMLRWSPPISFKLNEFILLLNAMDEEAKHLID